MSTFTKIGLLVVCFTLLANIQSISCRKSKKFSTTKTEKCINNKTASIEIITKEEQSNYVDYQKSLACACKAEYAPEPNKHLANGYEYTPGIGIYKLYPEFINFNQARKECMKDGAHLAIINSRAEMDHLLEMMSKGYPQTYVGIHNLFDEEEWIDVLGQPAEYLHWADYYGQQPDNQWGKEHCATLTSHEGLNDVPCSHKYPFFCEMPSVC